MLTANGTWKLTHSGKLAFFASFASFADKKPFPRTATPFDTRTVARPSHHPARRFMSISRRIIGVKISCMARPILPPGTTMLFGRVIQESCSIDIR